MQLPVKFVLISKNPEPEYAFADNSTIQWLSDETRLILSPYAITLFDDELYLNTQPAQYPVHWPAFNTMIVDSIAYKTEDGINLKQIEFFYKEGSIPWYKQQYKSLRRLINDSHDDIPSKHEQIRRLISTHRFMSPPNSIGIKEPITLFNTLIELGFSIDALNENEYEYPRPNYDRLSLGYWEDKEDEYNTCMIKLLLEHDVGLYPYLQNYALPNAFSNDYPNVINELIFGGYGLNCNITSLINSRYASVNEYPRRMSRIENFSNFHDGPVFLTGNIDILRMIVTACCDIDAQTINGFTALIFAAAQGHQGIVDLLLQEGADINRQAKSGHTALMMATAHSHTSLVKRLFNANADRSLMERSGRTASQFALQQKNTEIKQLFFGRKLPDWELGGQSNIGRDDDSEESTEHASAKPSAF